MKKILIRNPASLKKFSPLDGGLKSHVSFRNPRFWEGMDKCFGVRPNEKISGLEITDEGILATFETCKN